MGLADSYLSRLPLLDAIAGNIDLLQTASFPLYLGGDMGDSILCRSAYS
jgi:hypothetical protein